MTRRVTLQTPPRLEEKGLRKVDLYVFTTLDGRSKNGDSMKRRIISSWLAESRVSAVLIQFIPRTGDAAPYAKVRAKCAIPASA